MMRQYVTRAIAGLLVAFTAACSDSTGPEASVTGTYTLRSINGANVPVVVYQEGTYREEVQSGSITINSNNTFSATHTIRFVDGTDSMTATQTCTGTYSRNGSSMTLDEAVTADCGGIYNATMVGSSITVAYDATVQAVYSK